MSGEGVGVEGERIDGGKKGSLKGNTFFGGPFDFLTPSGRSGGLPIQRSVGGVTRDTARADQKDGVSLTVVVDPWNNDGSGGFDAIRGSRDEILEIETLESLKVVNPADGPIPEVFDSRKAGGGDSKAALSLVFVFGDFLGETIEGFDLINRSVGVDVIIGALFAQIERAQLTSTVEMDDVDSMERVRDNDIRRFPDGTGLVDENVAPNDRRKTRKSIARESKISCGP